MELTGIFCQLACCLCLLDLDPMFEGLVSIKQYLIQRTKDKLSSML